jgi:hypothetical protein
LLGKCSPTDERNNSRATDGRNSNGTSADMKTTEQQKKNIFNAVRAEMLVERIS